MVKSHSVGLPLFESVAQQDQDAAAAEAALEGVEDDGVELGSLGSFRQQGPEVGEHKHSGGCSGGCSGNRGGSPRRANLAAEYKEERPRPIFGLLTNILETARIGYRSDSPRAHLLY